MLKKILLLQLLLLVVGYGVKAQISPSKSNTQISQIKVDDLSDDQIRQMVAQMKKNNVSYSQIDQYAAQRGISDTEVAKLKDRITQLNLDKELSNSSNNKYSQSSDSSDRVYNEDYTKEDTIYYYQEKYKRFKDKEAFEKELKRRRIFGTELFSNQNLTFEPNLRMATPPNYRIAAQDELVIDVYGYSEVQHTLKVTPEGYVRIPNLGPVYVNGLTMDEARNRITKQLSTIYSGIKSGNTSVQVSLGNIRSIRVLLIGEIVRPGTYTLPSLATVANALYVSGGPNENGSFRSIKVVRNGQVVATFDLYDFLIQGDLSNNIVLQDQDIVKVDAYKIRVELAGEIKRPAIFEAKENETLQNILDFAGGYTDNSFKDIIKALRVNNKEREVVNIPSDQVASFKLKSGDKFYIDSILSRYTNRVTISGAIFHPGDYALEEGMMVGDLIKKADGVQEIAVMSRGVIRRLQADFTPSIISFNVLDVINGNQKIALQREDSVIIFSKLLIREQYQVKIDGEVIQPGYFNFGDSMHLEDLILLAGGLKDAASLKHVEISRRIHTDGIYDSSDARMAIINQFNINADLSDNSAAASFVLKPFDEVMIRKSPSYNDQANVLIDGEVVYPGFYAINTKQERISDIIRRAGGIRPEAYSEGAVLLRRTFSGKADSTLLLNKLEVFYNKLKDSTDIERLRSTIERKMQLLGIQMDQILNHPGSKYDLLLEEGDIIKVPKKQQTVQMFGEVYFPKKVRFDKNYTFRDYVRGAGGFTGLALKRRSYIVYSNGEVRSTKRALFFNSYPKVKPGAEIYVPAKKPKAGLSSGEAVGLASALASVALVIVTIINSTK
ncbi:protein involved in polysaccharide export, contains SLBB domain of the beta-grasp fold [Chitinophaga sp. CF118]|uniref:SLBB domain-containing protein n=1 Tax=Chitinophaga sp. CF118 TaxID=1884367 RepID=UPI0008E13619|nr:SLBB domain-containing protein [Chitinophaga sp. CF118]SFE26091.1 protein involved in polysaccharide export, contains SLBB domain of the beta-grasp fold [Chitinophaga sp. CF118]